MNAIARPRLAPARQALLAKLVIGFSTVVALATSAPEGPPLWNREVEESRQIALTEAGEHKLLVTIELGGELYAGAIRGDLRLVAVTDRAASDFSLRVTRLLPADSAAVAADGGTAGEVARPGVFSPTEALLGLSLACVSTDGAERAAACVEQFEVTLARESERPLTLDLTLNVALVGLQAEEPPGTFNVALEEVPE